MTTLKELGLADKVNFKPVGAGIYDAVIHGIVHLGLQPQPADMATGDARHPCNMLKIIFELPDSIRDDEETALISKDIPVKAGEKSNYYKLFYACFGPKTDMGLVVSTGVEELLGKKLALTVAEWTSQDGKRSGSKVESFAFLDPRLAAIAKPAKRDTFFFSPLKPDINIFNDTLTDWTRKMIMEALNAAQYPKELLQAYTALTPESSPSSSKVSLDNLNTESIE